MASIHVVCPHCDRTNRLPEEKLTAAGRCGSCARPLFTGTPLVLDSSRFARHAGHSDIPLLVDFWATWCGPCRMMAPVFEQAASQLEPQVRLIKIDSDANQALSAQYNIRSIPTLMLLKQGHEVARQAGAMDLSHLLGWVRQLL